MHATEPLPDNWRELRLPELRRLARSRGMTPPYYWNVPRWKLIRMMERCLSKDLPRCPTCGHTL